MPEAVGAFAQQDPTAQSPDVATVPPWYGQQANIVLTEIAPSSGAPAPASLTIPIAPDTISGHVSAIRYRQQLAGGAYARTRGRNPKEITWGGILPGPSWANDPSWQLSPAQPYRRPLDILQQLDRWIEAGTVLALTVPDTDLNRQVQVTDLRDNYAGGDYDVRYTLQVEEFIAVVIPTSAEVPVSSLPVTSAPGGVAGGESSVGPGNPTGGTPQVNPQPSQPTIPVVHVTQQGETLPIISQKVYYDDGQGWPAIYKANIDLLPNGAYGPLPAGIALTIPYGGLPVTSTSPGGLPAPPPSASSTSG